MSDSILRIGITMRIVDAPDYYEPRDALAHAWGTFLNEAIPSALWMPIPNTALDPSLHCSKWGINRLILSGGENYGQSRNRDLTEMTLLDWAEDEAIPVLGICRGMQLMAIHAGGQLKPVDGHVATHHKLKNGIISHEVNSFHTQALSYCPDTYSVIAESTDNEIEAISHKMLPWEGWMWHPERQVKNFNSEDIYRIRKLFT